ncbi:hypothetical protein CYMTET_24486 [Cymbomonas tetramitiformis]|uniref:Calponin-homology (CH) domain-containing protein n=1 Tax=Cymbomonas tetramitiformis TaxID=36881 RepID=A0AAE0KZX0_9CHLO|nr:hypothetical protein CYMTET_24486 [Cymbomonas tetramitiformis]
MPERPGWERMQLKTFTRWSNMRLKQGEAAKGIEPSPDLLINDILTDFESGVRLIKLVESLQGTPIKGKWKENPTNMIQKSNNLGFPLAIVNDFCAQQGLKLQYSAQAFLDGDVAMILGLVWVLISKFDIDDIGEEGKTAKQALLLWLNRKVESYGLKVANFTKSFQVNGGKIFAALIHKHRPDLIPDEILHCSNEVEAMKFCFDVAEKEFDIPQLLDAEDVVEFGDEKSMMTYVSYYWKAFASMQLTEAAARRLAKLASYEKAIDDMISKYTFDASELQKWMKMKTAFFEDAKPPPDIEEIERLRAQLAEYRQTEKMVKQEAKATVEASLNTLNAKLRANNRPPYQPPPGQDIAAINLQWADLTEAERNYEDRLTAMLAEAREKERAKQGVEALLGNYCLKAKQLREWAEQQIAVYSQKDFGPGLSEALEKEADLMTYKQALKPSMNNSKKAVEMLLKSLHERAAVHDLTGYDPTSDLTPEELNSVWDQLAKVENEYEAALLEVIADRRKQAKLMAAFDKKLNKAHGRIAALDTYTGNTVDSAKDLEEAQSMLSHHESYEDEHGNIGKKLTAMQALCGQMSSSSCAEAEAKVKGAREAWTAAKEKLESTKAVLEKNLAAQLALDEQRLEFSKKGEAFYLWVSKQEDAIGQEIYCTTLPEAQALMVEHTQEEEACALKMKDMSELEALATATDAANVRNPYARFTIQELQQMYERMNDGMSARAKVIANEEERQRGFNDMRQRFAKAVEDHGGWLQGVMAKPVFKKSPILDKEVLTQSLQELETLEQDLKDSGDKLLAEAAKVQEELDDALVKGNEFCTKTLPDVVAEHDTLRNALKLKRLKVEFSMSTMNDLLALMEQYRANALSLATWVDTQSADFAKCDFGTDLDSALMKEADLSSFQQAGHSLRPAAHLAGSVSYFRGHLVAGFG